MHQTWPALICLKFDCAIEMKTVWMIKALTLDMMICQCGGGLLMLHSAWQLTPSTYASIVRYQAEHGIPPSTMAC